MAQDNPYAAPSFVTESPFDPLQHGRREIRNATPEVGEILEYSFNVWKSNLLLLIGATVVVFAIVFGFGVL